MYIRFDLAAFLDNDIDIDVKSTLFYPILGAESSPCAYLDAGLVNSPICSQGKVSLDGRDRVEMGVGAT